MRGCISAALAYLLFAISPAQAQDGHARWHHYYRLWMQPGTTISCCNARIMTPWGQETGDCEPTRYEMRQGEWYAWVRQKNDWLHIPDDRIIKERNPSGEEGHLCYNPYTDKILCAVPPDTGG